MGTPESDYKDVIKDPQLRSDIIQYAVPALQRLTDEEVRQDELFLASIYWPKNTPKRQDNELSPAVHTPSLPARLVDRMEEPLSDADKLSIAERMGANFVTPERRYNAEIWRAHRFLRGILRSAVFQGRRGQMRRGVVARHLVKLHWRAIGIWGANWGFPGRRQYTEDDPTTWVWPWERRRKSAKATSQRPTKSQELILRALDQQDRVGRGGQVPVPPFVPVPAGTPASVCDSFLMTRPWFRFAVEVEGELQRWERISPDERRGFQARAVENVANWWAERGDWRREEWNFAEEAYWRHYKHAMCIEWVWEHDSPFQHDDVSHLAELQGEHVDTARMDFTPSEVDAWEDIGRPDTDLSDTFWLVDPGSRITYPGQIGKYELEVFRFHEREGHADTPDSEVWGDYHYTPKDCFGGTRDPDDENSMFVWPKAEPADLPPLLPPPPEPPKPPLRRSARIAALRNKKEAELRRQAIEARAKVSEMKTGQEKGRRLDKARRRQAKAASARRKRE